MEKHKNKKQKKKLRNHKRLLSFALSLTMAAEFIPGMAMAVNAGQVNKEVVESLAKAYNGDVERAEQELQMLHEAGVIDENGRMIEPDFKEDGKSVSLDELSARIARGEELGTLTANGYAITQDMVLQFSQAKGIFELINMMREGEKVKITDEHVANFNSLVEGLADGSIDLDSAVTSGSLKLSGQENSSESRLLKQKPLGSQTPSATQSNVAMLNNFTSANNANYSRKSGGTSDEFPSTKVDTGTVDADATGKYKANLIKDSTYTKDFEFQLADPTNKTYYTDNQYCGQEMDGIITLTCDKTTVSEGEKITVTATLDKAHDFPVSFDWAASDAEEYISEGTQKGTVTWAKK